MECLSEISPLCVRAVERMKDKSAKIRNQSLLSLILLTITITFNITLFTYITKRRKWGSKYSWWTVASVVVLIKIAPIEYYPKSLKGVLNIYSNTRFTRNDYSIVNFINSSSDSSSPSSSSSSASTSISWYC